MKHVPALLALSLLTAQARPQVVEIAFTAEQNGVHVPLDSILVTDLTQGQDTVLYHPDTVLVLGTTGTTGIGGPAGGVQGLTLRQNHPNPFTGGTAVELILDEGGEVAVGVHDALGRDVAGWRGRLAPGAHRFSFAGGAGTHVLWAAANGRRSTIRMVGMGDPRGVADLSYNGTGGAATYRSLSAWAAGDDLEMIGYATVNGAFVVSGPLTGAPATSTTYTFSYDGSQCDGEPTVTDIDGNTYPVVTIGSQCWMAANLRVSRYRNGDTIPNVTDNTAWIQLGTGAWCNYQNNADYDTTYGKHYNWYAAMDPRGVCPEGWHVPADAEWKQLESALGVPPELLDNIGFRGGAQNAGGKLKATTLWLTPNTGATNSTGFSALPGGLRHVDTGGFYYLGWGGDWWSATEYGTNGAWRRNLYFTDGGIFRDANHKSYGFCVRCLRD